MREHARKIRERLVRVGARLAFRCATAAALLALLATVFPWAGGVRPVLADHEGNWQVICPDPILEGNSAHMQLRMRKHHTLCATIFTYNGDFSADGSDYAGYSGVFIVGNEDSDSLYVPVVTHEDSKPERDETFSIGFWDNGEWRGCVIKIIDDDSPEITDVAITSKPTEGDRVSGWFTNKPNERDTYRAGESIDVTVTFDGAVEVDGTPLLSLFLDGSDGWRGARYHSGSGTEQLVFRYQVQPADRDDDGIAVGSASEDDERNPTGGFSGTIRAMETSTPVHHTHGGLGASSDHKVDGRPYAKRITVISSPPTGWSAYRANQIIEFAMNFDIDVEVHGHVLMDFYMGNGTDGLREATYARGSGSDTLVFAYTVQPGDTDHDGVQAAMGVPESSFSGGGRITARGTDVEVFPYYLGTGPLDDHLVDTAAPRIESVSIRSAPADGAAYRTGEVVEVAVRFSESVRFEGALQLDLDIGGEARAASFASGQSSSDIAVFHYTVAAGDADGEGIGIGANSLRLNGGGIHDGAGNAAGLSHAAVAADGGQQVDTSTQR